MSQTTWVHRGARVLVRPLVRTAVTPNQITTLRLVTGIAAAAAFTIGQYAWDATGGVLFVLSAFLDRADGELARLAGKISPGGARYDVICDASCNVMAFAGIGIGLSHGSLGAAAVVMGVISAAAVAASIWLADRLEHAGDGITGAAGFDPDDALFIVGPAAWFGALEALLIAAVIGAPLFLVYALWRYRSQRARTTRDQYSR